MKERTLTCIICPRGCQLTAREDGGTVTVSGNLCKRGAAYAESEMTHPTRTVTTTVRAENGEMIAVKTDRPIPKERVRDCVAALADTVVALPVHIGDTIAEDIFGAKIIATQNKEI